MSIQSIIRRIPAYAEDIKKNFSDIFKNELEGLTEQQVYGIALAISYSLKHEQLLNNIRAEAKMYLEEQDALAAKKAAIIMSMNNIYYNFVDAEEDNEFKNMPADLHMSVVDNPGVDKTDFEVYSLAMSILNKCKCCINVHTKRLKKKNFSNEGIKNIARIVATLRATVEALEIERLRSYDFVPREESF